MRWKILKDYSCKKFVFCQNIVKTQRNIRVAFNVVVAMVFVCFSCMLVACSRAEGIQIGETSPHLADVNLSAQSSMTEDSQQVQVSLVFDQNLSCENIDFKNAFKIQLNGKTPDESTIEVTAYVQENTIVIRFQPAKNVRNATPASGSYFALYQSSFSIASAREDGALVGITGSEGQNAVLDSAIEGVLPSGVAIEITTQTAGSSQENVRAATTFQVTSPALVRAITWFSVDGGQTKLLKHNHTFSKETNESCAADFARVINRAKCGVNAQASGNTITITATSVVDEQVIEPVIVQGVNVEPGVYSEAVVED